MSGSFNRRDLLTAAGVAAGACIAGESDPATAANFPRLASDFGPCPRKIHGFLQYIVQRRAAEGLNGMILSEKDPRFGTMHGNRQLQVGTVYGGAVEDANIAWTAAAAYRYRWSRFHRSKTLRNRAFLLLDSIARIRANGKWDDGGLDAYFGPHSLSWAVLSWMETGDVDAARAAVWRDALVKAADDGLVCLHYGPYRPSPLTGQYANPEMYFLSGLAVAWKLTGQERYREEAGRALRRYDDWLYDGGGMAYFLGSSPQHGYQQMAVKSIALYWELTQDAYALGFLKRLAPYFPNVQHSSGLLTDAEQPQLKHSFFNFINPATPVMIACLIADGANRRVADVATVLMADNVDRRRPSFGNQGAVWYNYQLATYAASALRLLESHPLPEPAPPAARRVFMDWSFRGPRGHWDSFTAAAGTRQMNDSLAGAYLADSREPLMPLGAALDGVYFEVLREKSEFRCGDWTPTVGYAAADGFASVSYLARLCAPYWGEMPFLAGEGPESQVSDWTSLQHWAVWRDCLIGFGALRCHGARRQETPRVRWRLSPIGRKLETVEASDGNLRFRYGGLRVDLTCLDQAGGFAFKPGEITEAPRAAWTPLLVRLAPGSDHDYAHVATIARPVAAEGVVEVRPLAHGAAAVLLEPDARKAYVWLVNLHRHMQQYLMDLPAGVRVRTYKRDVELPGVPPGEPANACLMGAESALWILQSETPLDARALLAGLRSGKSR